ncbi:xanthine dehydrogenase family protein molybdopterin-binding subunit [Clostridioides difficile]|uniref:Molybdopterin-dependent oxidoreductase n=1 Tax=Clostridioides difficile TaxID=1496 RepID=A0A9P3YMF4_CLODI|nr:molybdopterin cofactor-binding domain-containing protein [Clostridioides difficile]AWH77778.1 aldehyde oxidase [Clostridioides difficile]AWH81519.1 aldehyde oxidase [Clostridioides difficile]AXU46668.1 xanthine dehydrogenase, molybdenum binding subunit [Clostridioides difficile]AXU50328.1 xanthine dehydrogenase, molybdenum binding subunit [Clostridioides difficile]AXU75845.1 xanthine dehydrogenase, molybdenum binding subunit [Clostridioides difficile]
MVNKGIRKIDSTAIVTGKPLYTEDLIMHKDVLTLKLLRSPHAHAKIKNIDTSKAEKIPGVVGIYTYKDVPQVRYCVPGQTEPEASPYDRVLLEDTVRFIGDEVALVAAEDEKTALKALKMIKVDYEVLKPVFDAREAEGNEVVIHPEKDIVEPYPFGLDAKNNIVSKEFFEFGDVEAKLKESDFVVESSYKTQSQSHCMMETHRSYSYKDINDRIVVVSSLQSPHNVKRILRKVLGIPSSKIRVIKPRIGGGFGGKNIAATDIFTAFVTMKTGRPAKFVFTRSETFVGSNSRHEMFFDIKVGADKEGNLKVIELKSLNNTGAYGGNGVSVSSESGHNTLPIYNDIDAVRFDARTVYTNRLPAGALRGYGATQGIFAIDSAIDELAHKIGMDPLEFRIKNIIDRYTNGKAAEDEILSCELKQCIEKGKKLINWDDKYPCKDIGNNKVRAVGMAVANHGSGIPRVDMATVTIRMDEDGTYKLLSGLADLGQGADTIQAQIAAEALNTTVDRISIYTGDSDLCPYDTGAFASCTTTVTGNATIKTANKLKEILLSVAESKLGFKKEDLELGKDRVFVKNDNSKFVLLEELGRESVGGIGFSSDDVPVVLEATESFGMLKKIKPFIAGFAEIELDKNTGEYKVINFACVPDCGTVINPTLARIQVEGGVMMGIGFAMYEDPKFDKDGRLLTDSFLQYKVPTKKEVGNILVDFAENFDPGGPYGAKSLGEIVIHTPAPAIANAIFNATGVRIRELPMTFEKVYMGMKNNNKEL